MRAYLGGKRLFIVLPIAGLLAVMAAACGSGGPDPERPDKRVETTPGQQTDEQPAYGQGSVRLLFELTVPPETPSEDTIFIDIDGTIPEAGRFAMTPVGEGLWRLTFSANPGDVIEYKYNRNNLGYPTDEEFAPDSPDTRRMLVVGDGDVTQADTVEKWRWLTAQPPPAVISDFVPEELPARDEPVIFGAALLDFYGPEFTPLVPSTLDEIAASGFQYVGIAYSPRSITSADPLEFSEEAINSYSLQELESTIDEARKRGLKIMLSVGIESDPENIAQIDAGLSAPHPDSWWEGLVSQWQAAMVETADFAEEQGIEILAPSNQWPFWGYQDDGQRRRVNALIREAYDAIRAVYTGKLTSDYYDGNEAFDYYDKLDWIGDKWWFPLTQSTEPTLEEMQLEADRIISERYLPLYEQYGKPVFLHQFAYLSYDGAVGGDEAPFESPLTTEWNPLSDRYPFDFQEQADAYEAVFRSIAQTPWINGVFAFGYSYWDAYDKSAGIRSKPAEEVWRRWADIIGGPIAGD